MGERLKAEKASNKLWRRMIAFFIDIMAASVPMGIIMTVVVSLWEMNAAVAVLCAAVYTAAWLCKDLLKPSIGKRIMKMDIVSRDKSKPNAKKLIVRNLTLGLWFVELIIVSCSKDEERLTDKLLGLEVIYY